MADLEWHVMLGTRDPADLVVGRVESVDETGITVTRLEQGATFNEGLPVWVSWHDVIYLAMSGPDRDADLFDRADGWTGERPLDQEMTT
jgi:hypothetical protein